LEKKMKNKKFPIKFLIGALALVLVLATAGCSIAGGVPGPGATPNGLDTGTVSSITIIDNVEATGNIAAAQDGELSWKTSGIVEKVDVAAGDLVKTGDVLATLQMTSVPSNILSAGAELINAQQALDDLNPTALAISQAEQKVAAAQDDVKTKQQVYDSLGTPASQADIDQAKAVMDLNKIAMDKAWDRFKVVQSRPESNPIRAALYNRWADAQQKYDQAVRRYNNLTGLSVNKTAKELAQANLDLAKADLADAEKNLADLQAGPDAQDVAAAEARITAAKATLSALSITAPFDGEILVVNVQPGDVVNSGESAFTLADRSQVHVETLIDETDIHAIQVGDPAEITLDSLPGQTLTGSVAFINPMGETVSGNVKYTVRIDLDPIDQPLLLDATADVTIQTGAPREAMTVPVRAIQSDSQGEFVNVLQEDGTFKRVDITTGQLKGDQVVILSGNLQTGDQVELPVNNTNMFQQMQQGG
jgi:HlyD family secretion protein